MAPRGRGGRGGRGKAKQVHRETNATGSAARRAFPTNVIFVILAHLPVKSVLRFKSASKHWRTICNLPAFTIAHLNRSPAGLFIHATSAQLPQPDLPVRYSLSSYIRRPNPQPDELSAADHVHFPGYDGVTPLDVVGTTPNGLVCIVQQHLAQNFTLWNPATRSLLHIPAPKFPDPAHLMGASAGLAFDPSASSPWNVYTLIRIVRYHAQYLPEVAQIYSFQTGRWDPLVVNDVGGGVPFRTTTETCEVVVDGVPYWRVMENEEGMGPVLKLAWFEPGSGFQTTTFGWIMWPHTEMCLREIRDGYLGAMVWARQERVWMDRAVDVWTWDYILGAWVHTHKIEVGLQVVGRVVGFFGEEELVQEIMVGTVENPIPCLCMTKFRFGVKVNDTCTLDGAWPGTCKIARYRQSLTRLPRIGSSLISSSSSSHNYNLV